MLITDTVSTPNGLCVGDAVVYRDTRYVIAHVVDGGLRIDIGIGYAVAWHEVSKSYV